MRHPSLTAIVSLVLALGCETKILVNVYQHHVSNWTLALWIVMLGVLYVMTHSLIHTQPASVSTKRLSKKEFLLLLFIGLETIGSLWWFGSRPTHFHYDEFITATTSYTLPLFKTINWFGVFPPVGEWVCQFPILFHVLQYPFVHVIPTVLGVRISTWPYTIGTAILVFLITRLVTKKNHVAFYASNAFLFMAPQQYLGSLGVHFHAAVFFFMLCIYYFLKITDRQTPGDIFVLGLSVACCYLGYTAAYSIGPLLILMGVIRILVKPEKKLLKAYGMSYIIALLAISPWIVYAIRYDNFFLQRISQVNIITGTWVEPKNKMTIQNMATILPTNMTNSLSSFVLDHKSGVGDYLFGSMALLDLYSIVFLTIGFISLVILSIRKNFPACVLVGTTIILYITSVILTQNPTPFHRLSIDFPFFGICIGCGIGLVHVRWLHSSKSPTTGYVLGICILVGFGLINTWRAGLMIQNDEPLRNLDSIRITQYIQTYARPGDLVEIIAFSQYHLGKELFFRTNGTIRYITDRMTELKHMPKPQIIILHYPTNETMTAVKTMYPDAVQLHQFTLNNHAVFLIK